MSTDFIAQKNSQTHWTPAQIELLKNTVCKNASDDEFKIFCYAVQRTGLDPFMKQIHMVKRWNKKENRFDMSIQVGIDGYRLIADRTGLYAGNDEPHFDNEKAPRKATVTVFKIVAGQRCPFRASARWDEYFPGDTQGFMWRKMPCVMLGKVAEALALRKAFPAELSGLYTEDEMAQANTQIVEVQSEVSTPLPTSNKSNSGHPNVPGEVSKPRVAPEIVAEVNKIRALQSDLKIVEEDFKAELYREFQTETMKGLTLQQLQKFTAILEDEKKARASRPVNIPDETEAPWMQEAMGPIGA